MATTGNITINSPAPTIEESAVKPLEEKSLNAQREANIRNVVLSPIRNGPDQLTLNNQKSNSNLVKGKNGNSDVKSSTNINGMMQHGASHKKSKNEAKQAPDSESQEQERLEDQMNYEHLMALEKIFYGANETGSEGLDMDQFRVALKKTMGHDIDDRELDKIFMKVDTNCDGTVDWDEYLSYMLLEYQEKQSMFSIDQEHPLPNEISPIYTNHTDSIVAIRKMQGTKASACNNHSLEIDDQASRYYSMSKDGCLSILTNEWNLHKTIMLDGLNTKNSTGNPAGLMGSALSGAQQNKFINSKAWLADFVCMPNCNLIAVGGTDYEVVFYNSNPANIQKKFAFTQLADCALTLDYKYDLKDPRKCALVWGDTRGCITIVSFTLEPAASLFTTNNKQKNNTNMMCVPVNKIIAGDFPHVTCATFKVHQDWVKQVKFFTPLSDESAILQVVSCCAADETALCFSDYILKTPNSLDKLLGQLRNEITTNRKRDTHAGKTITGRSTINKKHKTWREVKNLTSLGLAMSKPSPAAKQQTKSALIQQRISHIQLRKGILCFDFDSQWNLIVTGSRDCDIRVWNMYVAIHDAKKSSTLLKGHKTSVTHIMVSSTDHMVVSISGDKNVRLWDLRDYSCRQSVTKKTNIHLGRLPITATYQNEHTKEVILGTTQLGRLESKNTVSNLSNRCICSHARPITAVLYNPLFDEVVTASEDAMVGVWDIRTGQKQMLFTVEKDVEITALAFDCTQRRLITGSRNGIIRVWNFNNGACLRELASGDSVEVSSIVCPKQYIMTAGWNKKLTAYIDSYTDDTVRNFKTRHVDDILSLAYHEKENILASSSYDGDILIWSLETEDAVLKFNVFSGPHALPISSSHQKSLKNNERDVGSNANDTASGNRRNSKNDERNEKVMKDRDALLKDLKTNTCSVKGDGTERAVYCLLMLESRKVTEKTAVLISAGVNCFVQAWSIHQRGGLVGRFMAGAKSNESILALATNKDNSLLITGDTSGYLKVWNIEDYCQHEEPVDFARISTTYDRRRSSVMNPRQSVSQQGGLAGERRGSTLAGTCGVVMAKRRLLQNRDARKHIERRESIRRASFSLVDSGIISSILQHRKSQAALNCTGINQLGDNLDLDGSGPPGKKKNSLYRKGSNVDYMKNVKMEPPPCKVSFKAHTKAITSIAINESRNIMITGSTDCSIRIWTLCGRYVGTLGQKLNWALNECVLDLSRLPQIIPDDVRRVASANTLRTIKGGVHTQWKTVKNALAFLTPLQGSKKKEDKEKEKEKEKEKAAGSDTADASSRPDTPEKKLAEKIKAAEKEKNKLPELKAPTGPAGGLLQKVAVLGANPPTFQRRPSITTIWVDDAPMKTVMEYQPVDKVEQTYQKYLEKGVTSTILGPQYWKKRPKRNRAPLSTNYVRDSAPGEGPRPPLAPVPQLTLQDKPIEYFTVSKHNPVHWESKHAIVYSRLPFANLEHTVVPKIGNTILSELGRTETVRKWNEGSFDAFRKHAGGHDNNAGGGVDKLMKLANKAKSVQRASNILKMRLKTSTINVENNALNDRRGLKKAIGDNLQAFQEDAGRSEDFII